MNTLTYTDIDGVFATGIHCGIKAKRKDLALFYVPNAVACAGVFTQNKLTASSVVLTRKTMRHHTLKAIIVNSGNANAGTGETGSRDSKAMIKAVAGKLGLKTAEVGVASTGVIGLKLPIDTILEGINTITSDPEVKEGQLAAEAILTTDLVAKTTYKSQTINGKEIVVSGTTKGSGMIEPNMATTLTFMFTNVKQSPSKLQDRFAKTMNASFNMISVDTDTSTNDMALCFATGEHKLTPEEEKVFQALLLEASIDLATQIIKDGEGATKMIETLVKNAFNVTEARLIAKQVINSPLVKTAIYGNDPNWGRIVAAACKNPKVHIHPNTLTLSIEGVNIFKSGEPIALTQEQKDDMFAHDTVKIELDLGQGKEQATAWGCDLSEKYIEINTTYT